MLPSNQNQEPKAEILNFMSSSKLTVWWSCLPLQIAYPMQSVLLPWLPDLTLFAVFAYIKSLLLATSARQILKIVINSRNRQSLPPWFCWGVWMPNSFLELVQVSHAPVSGLLKEIPIGLLIQPPIRTVSLLDKMYLDISATRDNSKCFLNFRYYYYVLLS